jgi:phage shock protein PspC (stress-responsive transcriptional regulator)
MIAGVCGGLGEYANIDPTLIRLAAVLLFFVTGPGVVIAYIIMALIIPEQVTPQAPQPPQA